MSRNSFLDIVRAVREIGLLLALGGAEENEDGPIFSPGLAGEIANVSPLDWLFLNPELTCIALSDRSEVESRKYPLGKGQPHSAGGSQGTVICLTLAFLCP